MTELWPLWEEITVMDNLTLKSGGLVVPQPLGLEMSKVTYLGHMEEKCECQGRNLLFGS